MALNSFYYSMSVNFSGINNSAKQPEVQKRLESQENFTALDKQKLQQDAVEIAGKTKEAVKENWVFRMLRNTFGVEDPKKFLKSVGMTLATVVGLAFAGNKLSNKTADLGITVDEALKKSNLYTSVTGFFKKGKDSVVNFFKKSKTVQDISETFKNRKAKQKLDVTRGYGRGFVSIFSLTPVDIIDKVLKKSGADDALSAAPIFKKLVGDDTTAKALADEFFSKGKDNRAFCENLSEAMRKYLGNGTAVDNKTFSKALQDLQKGTFKGQNVSEFINVDMVDKSFMGVISSWWPANIVNSIVKKVNPNAKGFCRGNLGDSLVKFNVVDGKLADTVVGRLLQKSVTVPTESITNFVNDKSGLGVLLCTSIVSLYNNVQDAPKEKRVATVADDYIGTIGSIALATPMAFGATYGLATLKNLKGTTIFSKVLKQVGKVFGMGLDKYTKSGALDTTVKTGFFSKLGGKTAGFAGGALRFFLVMGLFSPMIQKPLKNAIHKVFGKPYNKAEEEQQKALEEQNKKMFEQLGVTQEELLEKIQKNPDKIKALDTKPELVQKMQQNPKLLVDYLDGKDVENIPAELDNQNNLQPKAPQKLNFQQLQNSQMMKPNAIQSKHPLSNSNSNSDNLNEQNSSQNSEQHYDTASYIPKSEFTAKDNIYTQEQTDRINKMMQDADAVLKEAEKYI